MLKIHPFTISMLSKRDLHPLQAAANLSGERMLDMSTMAEHAPHKRSAVVVHSDLILPDRDQEQAKHLPETLKLRKGARSDLVRNAKNTLWVRVDWSEKRDDAQFARVFTLALPPSMDLRLAELTLREFAEKELLSRGMLADVAIHETRREGVVQKRHAYAMATTRPFCNGEFQNKNRDWNDRSLLSIWRKSWFNSLASALRQDQELSEEPEKHAEWLALCEDYIAKPAKDHRAKGQGAEEGDAIDEQPAEPLSPEPVARARPRL